VEPMMLRLQADRYWGDIRHVYAACLSVDSPHAFFLECELFCVPRHDHGLQEKPGVVRNPVLVVQSFLHRPVILPAIGKMDIMDYLTSDQLHQSILCAVELIATKCIAVIVQPFAPSLNGPEADFADNSHGTGRQSE